MDLINPVFIGLGSPINANSANAYTGFRENYARSIPVPQAIVVISAHWQTEGTFLTGNLGQGRYMIFTAFPMRCKSLHIRLADRAKSRNLYRPKISVSKSTLPGVSTMPAGLS